MEPKELFKIGDLVRLKSGGPIMTINYVKDYEENECICIWFNDKKEVLSRSFNPTTLVKIEE